MRALLARTQPGHQGGSRCKQTWQGLRGGPVAEWGGRIGSKRIPDPSRSGTSHFSRSVRRKLGRCVTCTQLNVEGGGGRAVAAYSTGSSLATPPRGTLITPGHAQECVKSVHQLMCTPSPAHGCCGGFSPFPSPPFPRMTQETNQPSSAHRPTCLRGRRSLEEWEIKRDIRV